MTSRKRAVSLPLIIRQDVVEEGLEIAASERGPKYATDQATATAYNKHDDQRPILVDLPAEDSLNEGYYGGATVLMELDNTITEMLPRYTALLKFLPENKKVFHKSAHLKIRDACDRIQKVFAAYKQEVMMLDNVIHDATSSVFELVSGTRYWYDKANLLLPELEQLDLLLTKNPIRDPRHFQQYLLRIVPQYLSNQPLDSRSRVVEVTQKLYRLHESLIKSTDAPQHELNLHLCVAWCAALAGWSWKTDWSGDVTPVIAVFRDRAGRSLHFRPRNTRPKQEPTYWDIASARRLLLSSYNFQFCATPDHPLNPWATPRCYHYDTIPLLVEMWDAAYLEISNCVLALVGARFPTELAELLLEFALVAEGLTPETRFRHFDRKRKAIIDTPSALKCKVMSAPRDFKNIEDDSDNGG